MPDGIALREALDLPALHGVRVLAGASGLGRMVRYVNVMEVPDILDWVKPDELLLTTAYPLRDDRAALSELVPRLAQKGLAGLAVKPARYLDEVPEDMRAAADRLAFPLLELPPETALADIINAVLSLILNAQALRLERSAAVHERFTSIVLNGGGPREIAQALAELIARPVALLDPQGGTLARSSDFSADGQRHVRPIRVGAEEHGAMVVLAEPDSLGEDELTAIEHASTVAALRLVQARVVAEADHRFQSVCLDELVTGHLTDRAVLHERAAAFGWDLNIARAVLVAEIDSVGGRRFAELAGAPDEGWACRRLAETARSVLGRDAIVWERSAGIAALTPLHPEGFVGAGRELQAAAWRRLPDLQVSIGIGRITRDPLELGASFTEALRALMVGRQAAGDGQVWLFETMGVNRLLLSCPQAELLTFHDSVLGRVLAYEREHPGCALLATLEAFLRARGNVADAARSLFVHYNTVRYRLERLEQLLGPFLNDPERWLALGLAMTVGRLLTAADYPQSATIATAPASKTIAATSTGRNVSLNRRRDTT